MNKTVRQINEQIMSHVEGGGIEYLPVNNVMDTEQVTSYPVEFINFLKLLEVPSHKLRLKVGVPILVMRNFDAPRLCNGTQLQIIHLGRKIVRSIIMTGTVKEKNILIFRVPIMQTDFLFQFKIVQFPLIAATPSAFI